LGRDNADTVSQICKQIQPTEKKKALREHTREVEKLTRVQLLEESLEWAG
jgi:hypothetical protein